MWTGKYWLMMVETIVPAGFSVDQEGFWPTCKVINYGKDVTCL